MILIEIGNTRWKAAYLVENGIQFISSGNDTGELLHLIQSEQKPVMFASVASDAVNDELQQRMSSASVIFMQVQTQPEFAGLKNAYADHTRLGVDRWLTLVAAHSYQRDCAIIDVGTAITFDLLEQSGQHRGGWIAPGLFTMQDSLVSRSSRIRARSNAPQASLGSSTEDGLFLGCRAASEGFIQQARATAENCLGASVYWLLTGGGLEYLRIENLSPCEIRPHLVLEGLAVVARNSR